MDLLSTLTQSAVVRVETALTPAVDVSLADSGGPPSPVLSFLRPRVTVLVDGAAVASAAPYGEPVPPDGTSFVLGAALLLVGAGVAGYLLLRR